MKTILMEKIVNKGWYLHFEREHKLPAHIPKDLYN